MRGMNFLIDLNSSFGWTLLWHQYRITFVKIKMQTLSKPICIATPFFLPSFLPLNNRNGSSASNTSLINIDKIFTFNCEELSTFTSTHVHIHLADTSESLSSLTRITALSA
ncbi:unnamed protein product [Ceratitis capitata]|uniref:(Mediterranean fruit fly) hypothetical protein n=1 Tax=Ceratitis capitata TaxID=7213 RepID=A0A811UJV9_CERCA|nr:unnamed protein product [Ceratitis capitata]